MAMHGMEDVILSEGELSIGCVRARTSKGSHKTADHSHHELEHVGNMIVLSRWPYFSWVSKKLVELS
jgi:hypothetical protein